MSVNAPSSFFPRPFAANGSRAAIPDQATETGRADFVNGFPLETQLPVEAGGIPPNRLDFNGILNMVSSFLWWMQSGGQWNWSATLDYAPPALVFRAGRSYSAVAESGPGTEKGIVDPATDNAGICWKPNLAGVSPDGVTIKINGQGQLEAQRASGVPTGVILPFYGTVAPEGYFLCNGAVYSQTAYPELYAVLKTTTLPDLRGEFLRFLDLGRGVDKSRVLGSSQTDTGRSLKGTFGPFWTATSLYTATGPFGTVSRSWNGIANAGNPDELATLDFDTSRVWGATHTANEFRPRNIALAPIIKY